MKFAMQDGRAFTSWEPVCSVESRIRTESGSKNSHEYRQYLQKNAKKLMENNGDKKCQFCPICSKALEYHPNK